MGARILEGSWLVVPLGCEVDCGIEVALVIRSVLRSEIDFGLTL